MLAQRMSLLAWMLVIERIGWGLRERYRRPEELPLNLLRVLWRLDMRLGEFEILDLIRTGHLPRLPLPRSPPRTSPRRCRRHRGRRWHRRRQGHQYHRGSKQVVGPRRREAPGRHCGLIARRR